jgi:predicted anti-sigma-YlaC factor YlaD
MLSCKDVSKLLSERLDRQLGLMERVRLRMHLVMCTGCSRVERQLAFLREAFSGFVKPTDRE